MQKVVPPDAVLIPDGASKVFDGVIHDVYQWRQELFDGSQQTFELLHRQDTVLVIGIDDGQVIIVTDTQPHRGALVGFPGGRVDASDQSTLAAAQREMREETGLEFANWKLITVIQPARKMEYFVYAYLAWDVTQRGEARHDGGEIIELERVDYGDLAERLGNHELPDAIRIIKEAGSLEGLLDVPEYTGKLIDRPPKVEK